MKKLADISTFDTYITNATNLPVVNPSFTKSVTLSGARPTFPHGVVGKLCKNITNIAYGVNRMFVAMENQADMEMSAPDARQYAVQSLQFSKDFQQLSMLMRRYGEHFLQLAKQANPKANSKIAQQAVRSQPNIRTR